MRLPRLVDDLADLVLARCCLGCGHLGPQLCAACLAGVRGRPRVLRLQPPLPFVVVAGLYDGLPGEAVVAYKERGNRSLATPLGMLLADAVAYAVGPAPACVLVPIPGHRRPARGFDALGGIARCAADCLRQHGRAVRVESLLASTRTYRPLKDLGRVQRQQEVSGAFAVRTRIRPGGPPVVLVDDVVTSGATVTEAVRTLAAAGIRVDAIAAVAAASRDRSGPSRGPAPPRIPR